MWEAIVELFTDGSIWSIVAKVLVTAVLSGLVGLIGTAIGKLIASYKDSKLYKYIKQLVQAAEQKFPNEGKQMGPEKLAYVMSQLVIKYPRIKDNRYLYNMIESAVFELNSEMNCEAESESPENTEDSNNETQNSSVTTEVVVPVVEQVVTSNTKKTTEKLSIF